MTQKEKDLILNVCYASLLYGITVYVEHDTFYDEREPYKAKISIKSHQILDDFGNSPLSSKLLVRPYLRPMESMMQGEWEEMTALIYPHGRVNCNPNNKNELLLWLSAEGNDMPIILMDNVFSWLNEHHFDYRGLIEKGLALPALEGMYND